ncbi:MAG: PilZ domain-containing protein [Candidatus Omnitrophica bacterium]|nr:PilZ domain-containing protein [Candidatus Omnitrophota bacterium]MBU1871315.1 PilZ domain-containing protein [Candidatus Omnitrophota bacterium]
MKEQERRREDRIEKTLFIQCRRFNTGDTWSSVTIQDVSLSGMRFVAEIKIPIEEILEIKFNTFLKKEPILIIGKVVASEQRQKGKNWVTHISIIQAAAEDNKIFRQFIEIFKKET